MQYPDGRNIAASTATTSIRPAAPSVVDGGRGTVAATIGATDFLDTGVVVARTTTACITDGCRCDSPVERTIAALTRTVCATSLTVAAAATSTGA
jgi:hypothetical protein